MKPTSYEDLKDVNLSSLLTKEEIDALEAFTKLVLLRKAWIGDWTPDWNDDHSTKYCIDVYENRVNIRPRWGDHHALSFPDRNMCDEFMNTFKDLLERAKLLL